MKIIDKAKEQGYSEWVIDFVERVLTKAKVKYNIVEITYIEDSKRIYLSIDENEYTIRTWNYHSIGNDMKGNTNKELVDYTLFKDIKDDNGSHGEEIAEGRLKIQWTNTYEIE